MTNYEGSYEILAFFFTRNYASLHLQDKTIFKCIDNIIESKIVN